MYAKIYWYTHYNCDMIQSFDTTLVNFIQSDKLYLLISNSYYFNRKQMGNYPIQEVNPRPLVSILGQDHFSIVSVIMKVNILKILSNLPVLQFSAPPAFDLGEAKNLGKMLTNKCCTIWNYIWACSKVWIKWFHTNTWYDSNLST